MSEKIKIFDVQISVEKLDCAAKKFCDFAEKVHFAATPNAEILLESKKNRELREFLQKCDFNFADSVAVLWAAEFFSKKWSKLQAIFELIFLPIRKKYWNALPEQVSGADLFPKICKIAADRKIKIFLVGGADGAAKKTAEILRVENPGIKIDFFDGKVSVENENLIVDKIKKFGAEIVFVALGCPKQELFLSRNLQKITTAKIGMGIGGSLEFFSKKIRRAPLWMRKFGIEWIFRVLREPRRIRRIFRAVVIFPIQVLRG